MEILFLLFELYLYSKFELVSEWCMYLVGGNDGEFPPCVDDWKGENREMRVCVSNNAAPYRPAQHNRGREALLRKSVWSWAQKSGSWAVMSPCLEGRIHVHIEQSKPL